jgi:hypothetical protein
LLWEDVLEDCICECSKAWPWPRREEQEIEWNGAYDFGIENLLKCRTFFNGQEYLKHNASLKQIGVVGNSRIMVVITENYANSAVVNFGTDF